MVTKIALAEAQDTKERLLKQKRLSLLCDLDQTLIHADVDPTIGKWKDDPDNPNYNALKVIIILGSLFICGMGGLGCCSIKTW